MLLTSMIIYYAQLLSVTVTENHEDLKHFGNVYCVMSNHTEDQDTSKPQNHKLITIAAYNLVISHLIGFFSTQ